jgi:serine/threonine protein kinase
VMELLEGQSVEALRQSEGGKLAPDVVTSIALDLLEVLAAAHEKGIVHRDIKPSNLFSTTRGALKVLDFGVAALLDPLATRESAHTGSGALLGTPAFMAPEQARSRWSEVDPRTDVWAVGATIFKLLSGEDVHSGETPSEQLGMAMMVSARSLASVAPHLAPVLLETVDRALRYERSERFSSARAMRDALAHPCDEAPDDGASPARERVPSIESSVTATAATLATIPGESAASVPRASSRPARRTRASVAIAGAAALIVASFIATRALAPAAPVAPGRDTTVGSSGAAPVAHEVLPNATESSVSATNPSTI